MKAAQAAREPDTLDSATQFRQELMESYAPANALERMLAAEIADSWERLQRGYELERKYFESRDVAEILHTRLDEFKAVTRYLTDCERAWRHALLNLEKAQRRRQRETAKTEAQVPAAFTEVPTTSPLDSPLSPEAAVSGMHSHLPVATSLLDFPLPSEPAPEIAHTARE